MSKNILWRKAAVLGGIWAASEIVLGSFLHNARVPFSGELLTAIGIAILVAGHRLWPERGLLWRAGLVCAAMKSVSPSAVIFGPMLAISMEGLLAEAGVRLLGCNPAGYLLAGGLAMCWALAHKAVNLLIFYGPDTVAVYLRGVEWMRLRGGFGPGRPLPFRHALGTFRQRDLHVADVVLEKIREIKSRAVLLLAQASHHFRRRPQIVRHPIRFLMGQCRQNAGSRVHRSHPFLCVLCVLSR